MGAPNVGKSTLFNKLLGEKLAPVTHKPQTTRKRVRGVLTKDLSQFVFVDLAGVLKPSDDLQSKIVKDAMAGVKEADVLAVMVRAEKPDFTPLVEDALNRFEGKKVLILSQVDRLKQKELLLPLLEKLSKDERFDAIVPISATREQGLEGLLSELNKILPEKDFVYDPDTLTDTSERDIAAELIREQLMISLNQELPYQCGVSIDAFDESRREDAKKKLVTIEATIHVMRDSQKRIVLGKGGSAIKKTGMLARKSLEAMLGCQVMLKTFVRVTPDWVNEPSEFIIA